LDENQLSQQIIGAAIEVHRHLGPGLLETAYEACLAYELIERGLKVERQKTIGVSYKGISVDCGFRIDLLVNQLVILEVKAVEKLAPIHGAQLLTYLRLTGCKLGLLLNFNETLMRKGIERVVSNL
jgi:GxxExxY protein